MRNLLHRTKSQRLIVAKIQLYRRNNSGCGIRHIHNGTNGKATNGGSGFAFLIVNAYNKNIIETGNFLL